jgi:hypothetical protein
MLPIIQLLCSLLLWEKDLRLGNYIFAGWTNVFNKLSSVFARIQDSSQDSPSIADVLGVERVRWVKTFAQHATLGVLRSC